MDREGDGLKASQSPARKRRREGKQNQAEPTYYPTIAEKRKGGKAHDGKQAGAWWWIWTRERVWMQLQDQTHQAIIIGAKMWESKRGIGSWRRLDGGQKRRAGGKCRDGDCCR